MREAVGDDIELTFDVHTRLDLPDVLWLCREVEAARPFFIEDPLRSENPDSFKTLRPRTHVPLAAGEQFSSKWEFRQLIEEEWIDYARIDLCIAGGITEARKIAGWCETHYIKLAVHNPLGPISSAACLQLNLATSNFGVQEQPRKTGTVLTDVVPVQPEWEDGYLLAPTLPGLGMEFDREAAKQASLPNGGAAASAPAGWLVHQLVARSSKGELAAVLVDGEARLCCHLYQGLAHVSAAGPVAMIPFIGVEVITAIQDLPRSVRRGTAPRQRVRRLPSPP